MKRAVVLTFALLGSIATSKAPIPDTGDTAVVEGCEAVSVDECLDAGCVTVDGRALEEDECVDYGNDAEPLGCKPVGACPAVETLAASASDPDTCYLFSSGCIPAGWTDCEWVDYGECR